MNIPAAPLPTGLPPPTFGALSKAILHWIGSNLWQSLTSAILSGAVGYVANAALMLLYYDGYTKTGSGPASGQGNLLNGSLIWGLGSTVVFSLVAYRRAVGHERFWQEVRNLPTLAQGLIRDDGHLAHIHLLWGAGIALATMQFVSPWLGAILGIALFTALPSFLMRVLSTFFQRVWSSFAGRFAPGVAQPAGAAGMVVGILGGAVALVTGFFIADPSLKFFMAAACVAGAWLLSRRGAPPPTVGVVLLALGTALLVAIGLQLLAPLLAYAHDGGLSENNGSIAQCIASGGCTKLMIWAAGGGFASATGAPIGLAIGNVFVFLQPPGTALPPVEPLQPPAPPAPVPPHEGQVDPGTGRVWSEDYNDWLNRDFYDQERSRKGRFEATLAEQRSQAEAANRAASLAESARTAQMAHDIATQRSALAAQQAADQAQRDAIAAKLRAAYAAQGRSADDIDDLAASGNTGALKDLYATHLRNMIATESAEAAAQAQWATAMDAGATISKVVLAGAKTGMMVVAGPAGYAAAAAGMGVIQSAEEGANAYVSGASGAQIAKSMATGFLSGAKDGAIGRYTNLPGVGPATKVLLPAAADAGEAYLRTGDARTAVGTGLLSTVAGSAGQALGGVKGTVLREGSQVLLGGAVGAAGSAMTGGSASEGFVNGLVNGVGSAAGGRLAQAHAPMTAKDIQADVEAAANVAKGKALVDDFANARTPAEKAAATKALLENRDAKLLMKSGDVDDGLKGQFAASADAHRTQPLFEGIANQLNSQKTADGGSRFAVREPDPVNPGRTIDRPVQPSDFRSGSGTAGGAPGMDLDFYAKNHIVDLSTGRAANPAHIDAAAGRACNDLGFSKTGQEINVTHATHAESFTLRPGETPQEFIARAGQLTGREAQSVSEVNTFKLIEANALHGGGAASTAEQCRTATKDFQRLTQPLLETHGNARLPSVFTARNAVTGETPLGIIAAVGNGTMPPGTGNARFHAMTGMGLQEGTIKMAGWSEAIAKGGAPSLSTRPPEVPSTFHPLGASPRDTALAVVRQALRTGVGELK